MTGLPSLLKLADEKAYEEHFRQRYLAPTIVRTFDGIRVRFFDHHFRHAFYCASVRRTGAKDTFSLQRAERMDWIAAVLQDVNSELRRRVMDDGAVRRIAVCVPERYAVIIQMEKSTQQAKFVTAYVVDSASALANMRGNPPW